MKYFKALSYLLLAAALVGNQACKDAPETESRMDAIMAVHDEVMPEMKTIGQLVAELKPMADSTEAGKPYREAMEDLQAAHQSMMDWMRGFGERFNHEEIMEGKALTDEKKEWLLEEEQKVNAMKEEVMGSIERARKLLESASGD